jgi:hypothetical protein
MGRDFIESYRGADGMAGDNVKKFDSGAVRSKVADHVRYDLITPIGLAAVAETYAEGAAKYGDHNWLKGMPASDLLNHAIRHVYLFLGGDRSEPHLPHAAWGLLAAIHSVEMWPHLNGDLCGPNCTPPGVPPAPVDVDAAPGSGDNEDREPEGFFVPLDDDDFIKAIRRGSTAALIVHIPEGDYDARGIAQSVSEFFGEVGRDILAPELAAILGKDYHETPPDRPAAEPCPCGPGECEIPPEAAMAILGAIFGRHRI